MNVAIWLLIALLALPFAEILVFVLVATQVGFGWALLAQLASSLTGALMLRHPEFFGAGAHVGRVRVVLGPQRMTALEADSAGTLFVIAGFLLLVPGFITDAIGVVLLIAPLRRAVGAMIGQAFARRAARTENVVDLEPQDWRQVPDAQIAHERPPRKPHEPREES